MEKGGPVGLYIYIYILIMIYIYIYIFIFRIGFWLKKGGPLLYLRPTRKEQPRFKHCREGRVMFQKERCKLILIAYIHNSDCCYEL